MNLFSVQRGIYFHGAELLPCVKYSYKKTTRQTEKAGDACTGQTTL